MKTAIKAVIASLLVVFCAFLLVREVQIVQANHDNSGNCPGNDHDGWVKVDGINSLTYTYTPPAGYSVTNNCMKVGSHPTKNGTGATVTNTTLFNSPGNNVICTAPKVPHNGCSLQNISHASFQLVEIQGSPSPSPSVTPSPSASPTPSVSPSPSVSPTPTPPIRIVPPTIPTAVICGSIEMSFKNTTPWFFSFDYRVDGEAGTDDAYTGQNIANGPNAGQPFGQRYQVVDTAAHTTENRTVSFPEDSGTHTVEYRLWRGAENDMYIPWQSSQVETNCEADDTPTPSPTVTPTPTVTPSPKPVTNDLDVWFSCSDNNWQTLLRLKKNKDPVQNAKIDYEFYGHDVTKYSNKDGHSTLSFNDEGKGTLKVKIDSFNGHEVDLVKPACTTENGEPQSAVTTRGRVLGASTEPLMYANTGTAAQTVAQVAFALSLIASGAAYSFARRSNDA